MKKVVLLLLFPSLCFADRLGSLRSAADVLLTSQAVSTAAFNATGTSVTVTGTEGLTSTYGAFLGSATVANLPSGQCVQTGIGGLLTVTGSACGMGGGGSAFSLAITTGGQNSFSGTAISSSSSTTEILFDSATTRGQLITGGTYFFTINTDSITAQGNTFNAASKLLQLDGSARVPAGQFPVLTGDITTAGGSLATTAAATQANITKITSALTLGANANAVTISSNLVTNGTTIYANGNIATNLSASLPVKTNATGVLTAAAVDLSGSEVGGTLAAARFPALTGDITNTGGALATTLSNSVANAHNWSGTATFVSSVTVTNGAIISSNTILPGATFYQPGQLTSGAASVVLGNTGFSVQIASNVVTPGATFYQGGSIYLGPGFSASLPLQLDAARKMTASAIDLSGSQAQGTLAAGRMPALTGDITTSAGAVATTLSNSIANPHNWTGTGTFTSSVTVNNSAILGVNGQTITISSNLVTTGATFYANAPPVFTSITGASLATCGDSSHGLSWTGGQFGCVSITGTAGIGDNLGNHVASTTLKANFSIETSSVNVSSNVIIPGTTFYQNAGWNVGGSFGTSGQVLVSSGSTVTPSFKNVANVQIFTSVGNNTWTKPIGATIMCMQIWGAGGSGGGGSGAAAPTTRIGGGGGGGGAYGEHCLPTSILGSTETVWIGAGGTSAGAATVGVTGGSTTFGANGSIWYVTFGGGGGKQGVAAAIGAGGGGGGAVSAGAVGTGTGNSNGGDPLTSTTANDHGGAQSNAGAAGGVAFYGGGGGGGTSAVPGNGFSGGSAMYGCPGGGAGGGATAASPGTETTGGAGGTFLSWAAGGGPSGGAVHTIGNDGATGSGGRCGQGGSGGGGNSSATGAAGGNGGAPGGGGGGGGGGTSTGGASGTGGRGQLVISTW